MDREIKQIDDMTISICFFFNDKSNFDGKRHFPNPSLRKIYNFRAREVLTVFEQSHVSGSLSTATSSSAVAMTACPFSAVEGKEDIELAYNELKALPRNKLLDLAEYLAPPVGRIRKDNFLP